MRHVASRLCLLLVGLLALAGCAFVDDQPPIDDAPTTRSPSASAQSGATNATPPDVGAVELSRDGLGVVALGEGAETALEELRGALGRPNTVTRWLPKERSLWGRCPGEQVRGAKWGDLWVLFSDETELGSGPHVFGWILGLAGMSDERLEVRTAEGIGVGSSIAELRAAYGERVAFEPYELGVRFTVAPPEGQHPSGLMLTGTAAGQDDEDTVRALRGGLPCEA